MDPMAILAAVLGFVATLATLVTGWRQHRNTQATERARIDVELQATRTTGINALVDQLQEQLRTEIIAREADRKMVDELRRDMGLLQVRMTEMQVGVTRLIGQLEAHGIEPVWRPPMWGG